MSERNDGGKAFPSGEKYRTTDLAGNVHNHSKGPLHGGMTLRDYFAAKAMSSLLVADGASHYENRASDAYAMADAMLKAREAV